MTKLDFTKIKKSVFQKYHLENPQTKKKYLCLIPEKDFVNCDDY